MPQRLQITVGDITKLRVDAMVNAANEWLLGGGGVDGAIHSAAGPELLAACRAIPEVYPGVRCPTGQARITPAFRLPAKFVIHTVGPVWRGGTNGEPELLAQCYRGVFSLVRSHGIRSIAFPAISTGVFSFPLDIASQIAVRQVRAFLASEPAFDKVILVAFRAADAEVMRHVARSRVADLR